MQNFSRCIGVAGLTFYTFQVATDVAAPGLDIPDVEVVIN